MLFKNSTQVRNQKTATEISNQTKKKYFLKRNNSLAKIKFTAVVLQSTVLLAKRSPERHLQI
jgi:hypothetical protein